MLPPDNGVCTLMASAVYPTYDISRTGRSRRSTVPKVFQARGRRQMMPGDAVVGGNGLGTAVRTELGHALRRAREAASMTLADVGTRSQGRFSPTVVGGYERGEHVPSVTGLCELAMLYGTSPAVLLNQALRPAPAVVRLGAGSLEGIQGSERRIIEGFVDEVRSLRAETGPTIALRHQDVEILADAVGISLEDLLRRLEPGS